MNFMMRNSRVFYFKTNTCLRKGTAFEGTSRISESEDDGLDGGLEFVDKDEDTVVPCSTSSSLLDDKTGLWNGVGLVGGVTLYLRFGGIIKQESSYPLLSFTICCYVSDGNITGLNTIDVADVLH
ncbi:D-alanyl-D-alanine dipeptidase [Frankliniella fusca]|uniref:D-alanyl-D-alanine dipeptidase n=1 Tax=Frankliniella fusca TaxID=407009 RepID=A0AAE1H7K7_9NEOP|nr:D-alanyl-D-alanine dipeptidase [Frankliniella fusca]